MLWRSSARLRQEVLPASGRSWQEKPRLACRPSVLACLSCLCESEVWSRHGRNTLARPLAHSGVIVCCGMAGPGFKPACQSAFIPKSSKMGPAGKRRSLEPGTSWNLASRCQEDAPKAPKMPPGAYQLFVQAGFGDRHGSMDRSTAAIRRAIIQPVSP